MSLALVNQVPAAPAPPAPPAPPPPPAPPTFELVGPAGSPSYQVVGPDGGPITLKAPTTAREVQMLRQRGSELSRQLTSANGRRDQLARQLEDAQGTSRAGIEQRIAQLDRRIMQIEADIEQNGKLLALAPAGMSVNTETSVPFRGPLGLNPGQLTGISIVGTIFVLFPLAIAMARNIWRRGNRIAPAPASAESSERMERLEQAVDAIAIEIERVSEGQRYVTRLLTEGTAPALSVGQKVAEPVRLPERDAIRASRESA